MAFAISNNKSRLLKQHLCRQAEFKTAERLQFSFEDEKISVDGYSGFSESSTVVLRHILI